MTRDKGDVQGDLLEVGTRQERVRAFLASDRSHLVFSDFVNPCGNGCSCAPEATRHETSIPTS